MRHAKKVLAAALGLAMASLAPSAFAAEKVVKIGVLGDQSGYLADLAGPGSVMAVRLAIEDFGGKVNGLPIEVVVADHQNKADIGANIARKWVEAEGVDVVTDVANSAVALSTNNVIRQANKVFLAVTAATTRLTNEDCSPNTVQWTNDTWANANSTASAVVKNGGKSWFFLTTDFAFGHDMEAKAAGVVKASKGQVVGGTRVPVNTTDFSSPLLQAQASGAKVLGLAIAGNDATNAIKQGREYQLQKSGINFAALALYVTDIHALGLDAAQGMYLSEAFYWDLNPATRKFSDRFAAKMGGKRPTSYQAGNYSATLHYLKAVAALKSHQDGAAVIRKMKELPTDDAVFGKGSVRQDGRKIHPMYLFQVKSPAESKGPWDYYKLIDTVSPADAWQPLSDSKCSLVTSK